MGNFLSFPVTDKTQETGSNKRFAYGIANMQGWRTTMEDAHAAVLDLDGPGESNTFFAVYDGHKGSSLAKYAGENLHKRLITEETYKEKKWESALKAAFLGVDEDVLKATPEKRDPSGCTAIAALITTDNFLYVANVGDSRSVLSVKGEVKALSTDHKPTTWEERERILKAGGYVEEGRTNGNLAMSRSLGDFEYKQKSDLPPEEQIVTAYPDVTMHEITEEDEFLVLACDGIWDCLSSQSVVDIIRYQISEGKKLVDICAMIFDHCLAPDTNSNSNIGCDNMSLIIVAITHGRSIKEWTKWIKKRVATKHGYETPKELPRLYSAYRVENFKARQKSINERKEKEKKEKKGKS